MPTFYYSKKLTASTTEQEFELPILRDMTIINAGPYNLIIQFDGPISEDSVVLPVGASLEMHTTFLTLKYQAQEVGAGSETAEFSIVGLRHEKI